MFIAALLPWAATFTAKIIDVRQFCHWEAKQMESLVSDLVDGHVICLQGGRERREVGRGERDKSGGGREGGQKGGGEKKGRGKEGRKKKTDVLM